MWTGRTFLIRDDGRTRGHEYKLKKTRCLNTVKKFSSPSRSIDAWSGRDTEVVQARNIHDFKTKLDKSRYGDRTIRA